MDLGNLESSDFFYYRLKMFINLGIAMAANTLGFILILWASPKNIQTYRWFLLNILFSAFCLDLYMMAIYQPFVLFPVLGYCTLGILSTLGQIGGFIGVFILFALLGFCAASVLCAALFRLAAIYNCHNLLIGKFGIFAMAALHLFIPVPMQIVASFVVEELNGQMEEELKANISQKYPNMRNILNSNEVCIVATMQSLRMRIALFTAVGSIVIVAVLGISMIIMGFVTLHMRKAKYSERLYKMHMQLGLSLLVQISIPGILLLVPFFVLVMGIFFQFQFMHDIIDLYFLFFSMHSTLNAFAMIMFTRPYRDAVKKWLFKFRIIQFIAMQFRGNSVNQMESTKTQTRQGIQLEQKPVAITKMPVIVNEAKMANPVEARAEARKKSARIRKVLTKVATI